MSIFVRATEAKKPRTKDSQKMAYFYAAILVVFVLGQLFAFDEFLTLIDSFWLFGGQPVANFLGSMVVVSEVFAIPFLLNMRLSSWMRKVSMVLGWLVPVWWLFVSVWLLVTVNAVSNIGFLGTKVELLPGTWAILVSIAIGILAAWSTWGLWPGKRNG